jgi:hypothetical protein
MIFFNIDERRIFLFWLSLYEFRLLFFIYYYLFVFNQNAFRFSNLINISFIFLLITVGRIRDFIVGPDD